MEYQQKCSCVPCLVLQSWFFFFLKAISFRNCAVLPVMKISSLWNAEILNLWNLVAYEKFQDDSISCVN